MDDDQTPLTRDCEEMLAEIESAEQRFEKLRGQGSESIAEYLCGQSPAGVATSNAEAVGIETNQRLNLYHRDIEMRRRYLLANMPEIEVKRRDGDAEDHVARVASILAGRTLKDDLEREQPLIGLALLDWLLCAVGVNRILYHETKATRPAVARDERDNVILDEAGMPTATLGDDGKPATEQYTADQECETVYVPRRDFLYADARVWGEVEWVAFRSWLTREEVAQRFGATEATNLEYEARQETEGGTSDKRKDMHKPAMTVGVWEVWHKGENRRVWLTPSVKTGTPMKFLDAKDGGYDLEGFFPCPAPLFRNLTNDRLMPMPDFEVLKPLYRRLHGIQDRIARIERAMRPVAVVSSRYAALAKQFSSGDDGPEVVTRSDAPDESALDDRGMEWIDLKTLGDALESAMRSRAETISLIERLSGTAEILRSDMQPRPQTATEATLKAKASLVGVGSMAKELARFVEDLLQIKLTVIVQEYSHNKLLRMANAMVLSDDDKALVPQAIALLGSDDAKWRVEVDADSMVAADGVEDEQQRTRYLDTLGKFIGPLMELGKGAPMLVPPMVASIKHIAASMRGGKVLEAMWGKALTQIEEAAKNPQGPQPAEGEGIAEARAKADAQIRVEAAKHQFEMQSAQQKAMLDSKREMAQALAAVYQETKNAEVKVQLEAVLAEIKTGELIDAEKVKAQFEVLVAQMTAGLQAETKEEGGE